MVPLFCFGPPCILAKTDTACSAVSLRQLSYLSPVTKYISLYQRLGYWLGWTCKTSLRYFANLPNFKRGKKKSEIWSRFSNPAVAFGLGAPCFRNKATYLKNIRISRALMTGAILPKFGAVESRHLWELVYHWARDKWAGKNCCITYNVASHWPVVLKCDTVVQYESA